MSNSVGTIVFWILCATNLIGYFRTKKQDRHWSGHMLLGGVVSLVITGILGHGRYVGPLYIVRAVSPMLLLVGIYSATVKSQAWAVSDSVGIAGLVLAFIIGMLARGNLVGPLLVANGVAAALFVGGMLTSVGRMFYVRIAHDRSMRAQALGRLR